MKLKQSVHLHGVRSEIVLALLIADGIYASLADELVITSVIDGRHMRGSLHYIGAAADIRLPSSDPLLVRVEIAEALGAQYDVVLESDHIHIEFQPKTGAH